MSASSPVGSPPRTLTACSHGPHMHVVLCVSSCSPKHQKCQSGSATRNGFSRSTKRDGLQKAESASYYFFVRVSKRHHRTDSVSAIYAYVLLGSRLGRRAPGLPVGLRGSWGAVDTEGGAHLSQLTRGSAGTILLRPTSPLHQRCRVAAR